MADGVRCPRCGGSEVRELQTDLFECERLLNVNELPASVTGVSAPEAIMRPCGKKFWTCEYCDEVSRRECKAPGCDRGYCLAHGDESFCQTCLAEQRAEEESEKRKAECEERLQSVFTKRDLGELIGNYGDLLDAAKLTGALSRYLTICKPPHSHELVEVFGEWTPLDRGRGSWLEGSREPIWFVLKEAKLAPDSLADEASVVGAVVDASGALTCALRPNLLGLGPNFDKRKDFAAERVILPRGAKMELERARDPELGKCWIASNGFRPAASNGDAASLRGAIEVFVGPLDYQESTGDQSSASPK